MAQVIGLCLYVGRERPDLAYTIKELSSVMSAPTTTSLLHLRKLIGFMKWVGDVGVRMDTPQPGAGKFHSSGNCAWILENMSDCRLEFQTRLIAAVLHAVSTWSMDALFLGAHAASV